MAPQPSEIKKPRFEWIPEELRAMHAWVLWRQDWREGTGDKPGAWTKPPVQTNGRNAKSNDPKTWATFDDVVGAYGDGTAGFAGIGIMLEGSDIVGIDLDDKEGLGTLFGADNQPTTYLSEILAGVDSYTEVSPSGKGVRIFARGTIPASGRRGAVEMYASGSARYMTVTGRRLPGTPATIEERTDALAGFHARYVAAPAPEEKPAPTPRTLPKTRRTSGKPITPKSAQDRGVTSPAEMTDDELLEVAQKSANGAKFTALWGGDLSAHGGDHSAADMALASHLLFFTGGDTARSDKLFRCSGLYRQKWDERHHANGETYGKGTLNRAVVGMTEFYKPSGFDISEHIERLGRVLAQTQNTPEPIPGAALGDFNNTDGGNADRLVYLFGDNLKHVPGLGWRVWTGKRWEAGEELAARCARDVVRALYGYVEELAGAALQESDPATRKLLAAQITEAVNFAKRSDSAPRIAAIVTLAKSDAQITADPTKFDLKPWRVAFPNGTWDRGEWREHRREDFIEALTAVPYDPKADRSDWYALLGRMTGGDEDLALMLQDVAGYAFSGASSMRLLPWLYGPKGTGKSTFVELLQTVLGPCGKPLDWALLTGDKEGEKLGATIRNMRAVFLPEAGRKRLDADLLKVLSGGDRLPGRNLYQTSSYTVTPTWALIAVSNDPPNMNAYDDALRDRLRALPFLHSLSEGGRLKFTHGEKLETYRRRTDTPLIAGFTTWAVEGLERIHLAQDVHQAKASTLHTQKFWADADPLTPFWEQIEDVDRRLKEGIKAGELRSMYLAWCEQEGIRRPLAAGTPWGDACRAKGLRKRMISRGPDKGSEVWELADGGLFTR